MVNALKEVKCANNTATFYQRCKIGDKKTAPAIPFRNIRGSIIFQHEDNNYIA